jgi:hypothetical protein
VTAPAGTRVALCRCEVHVEIRDGFIVGIFNYCDRWCEACPFTSRCRLFADVAETEAALDPNLKPVVEAPVLRVDAGLQTRPVEAAPPPWLQEMIDEMNKVAATITAGELDVPLRASPPQEHVAIEERAKEYCFGVYTWLQQFEYRPLDPSDPCSVIGWFHTIIPAKVHRAINGLAEDGPEDRDWPPDHDGSAKVALLGIERSHAAWLDLIERGVVSDAVAAPFIAELVWLGDVLEQVFPRARAFVRPAFDEPDEVAMLLLRERRVG